jgi:Ser/Thr protein kinase RdoA (MazF antagonist)
MKLVLQAAEKFIGPGETVTGVEEYGHGIIHDTYLVKLNHQARQQFILQRVNTNIFKNPAAIMHNLKCVSEHVRQQTKINSRRIEAGWQMLHGIPTGDGSDLFNDADGNIWRALSFIQGARPLEKICSLDDAREVGRAIGTFHFLTSHLNPDLLYETLPGYHNVEQYLKHYDEVAGRTKDPGDADEFCQNFIENRRSWAPVLEIGRREKTLRVRVIHGDPKINNIMIDSLTGKAVSIIDLDTIMPGLVHYDIGDCLRSCCNIIGEDSADLARVRFDLNRCKAVLTGYTGAAKGFLTDRDFDFLFDAIRLIPFELGLRFYTDYLEGNVYFKVSRDDQNLDRALVQFKLVESIEKQEVEIRMLIEESRAIFTMNQAE